MSLGPPPPLGPLCRGTRPMSLFGSARLIQTPAWVSRAHSRGTFAEAYGLSAKPSSSPPSFCPYSSSSSLGRPCSCAICVTMAWTRRKRCRKSQNQRNLFHGRPLLSVHGSLCISDTARAHRDTRRLVTIRTLTMKTQTPPLSYLFLISLARNLPC